MAVDRRVLRIMDANLNRAREGLRVCEDVVRFGYDDATLALRLKRVRHGVTAACRRLPVSWRTLLAARASDRDVGRRTGHLPSPRLRQTGLPDRQTGLTSPRRATVRTLGLVNLQRAKEALRVLEESGRLIAPAAATTFARLRFRLYALEAAFARHR